MAAKMEYPSLPQCSKCGKRAEINGQAWCEECSVKAWTLRVIVGCVLLVLLHIAGLTQAGTREQAQKYADLVTGPKNLATVVVMRHLGDESHRGASEIGLVAGKMVLYRVVLNHSTLDFPTRVWQNTVRHEICHLMVARRLGYIPAHTHGRPFKRCAARMNVDRNYND